MLVLQSKNQRANEALPPIETAVTAVDQAWLRSVVERVSIPRHYEEQPESNRQIASWIEEQFQSWGYQTFRQGEYDNIVAMPAGSTETDFRPRILIGAHYDSKPETPGADDNGSAVAAMLGCAKAIRGFKKIISENSGKSAQATKSAIGENLDVVFVAFNREEDGLLGSCDFVENYLPASWNLEEVHILEMVGYCDHAPGSQGLPPGLPLKLAHDRGDFLALIANRHSNFLLKPILKVAATYVPGFPVWGLKVFFGLEKKFSDLRRSDHAPFWDRKIPAFMWTDTSEFRNANYHQPSDTPDTLDYEFLQKVTQLLVARCCAVG